MPKPPKAAETTAPAPDRAAMQQLDRHPAVLAAGEMQTAQQAPSLGRIVLFTPDDGSAEPEEYVAIIGRVLRDPSTRQISCDLLILQPGVAPRWFGPVPQGDPAGATPRTWRFSPRVAV